MKDLEKVKSKGLKDLRWGKGEEEECFQNNSPTSGFRHWAAEGIFCKDRKYRMRKKLEEKTKSSTLGILFTKYVWNRQSVMQVGA